jgi:hypothetical protein
VHEHRQATQQLKERFVEHRGEATAEPRRRQNRTPDRGSMLRCSKTFTRRRP